MYVEFIKEKEKEKKEKGKDTRRIINCITQSRLVYCFQCEQTRSARLAFKLGEKNNKDKKKIIIKKNPSRTPSVELGRLFSSIPSCRTNQCELIRLGSDSHLCENKYSAAFCLAGGENIKENVKSALIPLPRECRQPARSERCPDLEARAACRRPVVEPLAGMEMQPSFLRCLRRRVDGCRE